MMTDAEIREIHEKAKLPLVLELIDALIEERAMKEKLEFAGRHSERWDDRRTWTSPEWIAATRKRILG